MQIKSYARRIGHFTDSQKKAYSTLSEKYLIPVKSEIIDFNGIFANNVPVTVEIGFGMGFATAEIAQANPDKNYLGIEVHKPGIGRLLWEIENRSLSNIRIIEGNAVNVMTQMIKDESLSAIHIFFPDPWPKKRHHKRRLVQRPFTGIMSERLKKTGYLYMVTDWENYALHALTELSCTEGLSNIYENFSPPQKWRPLTKFEQKGILENRQIYELFFTKI